MLLNKIDYDSYNYFACDITPKRIITKYELEIYMEGEGASYIDGKTYAHSSNKVIFAKPGQERFSTGRFFCYAIHFTCDDKELIEVLQRIPDCCIVSSSIRTELVEYYKKIETKSDITTYSALFHILELLSCHNSIPAGCGIIPTPDVLWIKEYLDSHFTTKIDIVDLAKQVYLSPNYLRKKFAEAYGTTIQKYIIEMRLGMVKKLLLTTNKSLSDIAYCSGFNSQSHMNVMFHSLFGVAPLEYKKTFSKNGKR